VLCGHETALALLSHYGGCHVCVPRHALPVHRLAALLGWQQFKQLCANYGGEIVAIPKATAARLAARNAQIKAERRNGATLSTIARRYDLTTRHVLTICKPCQ